jgi:hypothetical protein
MSSADKTKLDGLSQVWTQAGTNLYPTATATTNVGVKTATPWGALSVLGNGTAGDPTTARQFAVGVGDTYQVSLGYFQTGAASAFGGVLQALENNAGTRLLLNPSGGTVGIGTLTPTSQLEVVGDTVANTVNAKSSLQNLRAVSGNQNQLITFLNRFEAGNSWEGCNWRLQQWVEAQPMGFIDFNPTASSQGIALGTGGTLRLNISSGGTITISNLAGAGTRMVVADANGLLSSAAFPAGTVTGVTGTLPIVSSGGAAPDISINAATTTTAGSMSSSDKTKLDGLSQVWTQAGANLYPTTTTTTDVGIGLSAPQSRLHVSGGEVTVSTGGFVPGEGGVINFGIASASTYTPMSSVRGSLGSATGTELQGGLAFLTRPIGDAGQTLQERLSIAADGVMTVSNLAGTGTRLMFANSFGILVAQSMSALPDLP